MSNPFVKATKKKAKLRLALGAPSGAGKTYTALEIATGLAGQHGKIAVIDSEHGSASKYSDLFNFDTVDLEAPFTVQKYIDLLNFAGENNYDVLIMDSLTHAWDWLVGYVEQVARAKYRGNTFTAWSEGTPIQDQLIQALLSSPCHVIATVRTKNEYAVDQVNGKTKITRMGTKLKQREGFEYEFDMFMTGNIEHFFTVEKDRTGKYQDQIIEKPNRKFGEELKAWLDSGADVPVVKPPTAGMGNANQLNQAVTETMVAEPTTLDEIKAVFSEWQQKGMLTPELIALLKDQAKKAGSANGMISEIPIESAIQIYNWMKGQVGA
jgi:hypothetical protein